MSNSPDVSRGDAAKTGSISLSLVIPAYNEEHRLPQTLLDAVAFLDERKEPYEIIVVDDGSTDGTARVVEQCPFPISLIKLSQNMGKGGAVRAGMLAARGARLLFADADGSTPIAELKRLESALAEGADIAIGSRAIGSPQTAVVTNFHRKFLGRCFNFVINLLLLPGIADTQCGFKMFTAQAARFLFTRQTARGFSLDLELLFLARRAGMTIAEVPVNWHNVPGSKVNLILDAARMFRDAALFRWRHRMVQPADFNRP